MSESVLVAAVSPECMHRDQQSFSWPKSMTRQIFAQRLAVRMLAGKGMTVIWELHVAAAEAHQRGRSSVAATLIEIADAAELPRAMCAWTPHRRSVR
jgi:aspartate aminotransferase-like enzyme